jgi:hypothetical protein
MNLYLIEQDINQDYETYDSAVVCCNTEDEARSTHPGEYTSAVEGNWVKYLGSRSECKDYSRDWVSYSDIGKIKVTLIGIAGSKIKKGVVISSYNAG